MNALDVELDTGRAWASFISAVHPAKDVRESAEKCKKDLSALANEIALDPRIYAALEGVDVELGCSSQTLRPEVPGRL